MIRFEANTFPFAITNDQMVRIYTLIAEYGWGLDYDVVEGDTNGIVWLWVHYEDGIPVRHWIETDGIVSLSEEADWVENNAGVGFPTPLNTTKEGAVSAEEHKAVAARLNETRAALDEAVYAALQLFPQPAITICQAAGLEWAKDAPDLRGAFLRLQEQGKAKLTYGQGWAKVATA